MRAIKFRAWNVATKTMIDLKKITPLALSIDTDGLFIPFSDGLPLMQYTGLKDKNGKEIYEGDVVKMHESDWHDLPESLLLRVHWCTSGFGWCGVNEDPSGHHVCSGWTSGSDMEVIGNIYEHKHLLDNNGVPVVE